MSIFQVVSVGILGVVLTIVLKKQHPEYAILLALVCGVVILLMVLPMLGEAIGFMRHLSNLADGLGEYTGLALRVIGVAYMAEIGSSVCADANESAIAAKIDLAGRVIILVMALPVIADIISVVTGLI